MRPLQPHPPLSRAIAILLLIAIWAAVYLPGLGGPELKGEEARRILPAIAMLEGKSWIVPEISGEPYLRKPPLVNWAIAAAFAATGQRTEWAARLPSALAALGLALGLFATISAWRDPANGFVAATISLTTLSMMEKGRLAEIEAIYAALSGLATIATIAGVQARWDIVRTWVLPGVLLGLAFLAKGPVHLLFYAGAVLLAARPKGKGWLGPVLAATLCAGIAAAWILPYRDSTAHLAVDDVWKGQTLGRFTGDFDLAGWALNLPRAASDLLPWAVFLPLLWLHPPQAPWFRPLRNAVAGMAIGLLLLPGTLPRYAMPLWVPMAVLIAETLCALAPDALRPWCRGFPWLRSPSATALAINIGGLCAAIAVAYALLVVPALHARDTVRPTAAAVEACVKGSRLYALAIGFQPWIFYLRSPVVYLRDEEEIPPGNCTVVLPEKALGKSGVRPVETCLDLGGKKRLLVVRFSEPPPPPPRLPAPEPSTAPASPHPPQAPPWPGKRRIAAEETGRMTPADIIGPDGIVYPDWRAAGIPGGIPKMATVTSLSETGGIPDDDADDAGALEKAVALAAERGGGAIAIGPGVWHLDHPVVIASPGIVLRGPASGEARIVARPGPDERRAWIIFRGPAPDAVPVPLTALLPRGGTRLEIPGKSFGEGDRIRIVAPATAALRVLLRADADAEIVREGWFEIVACDDGAMTLSAPARLAFDPAEGAFAQRIRPIERCGIENLTLEMAGPGKSDLVAFRNAWGVWMRSVRFIKPARDPWSCDGVKHAEFRDITIEGSWGPAPDGEGAGWSRAFDCLLSGARVSGACHGPVFSRGASGCVVRDATFSGGDARFSGGYAHENLIENVSVTSLISNGGSGVGLVATADERRGPSGPRNTVYASDFAGAEGGIALTGPHEAWILVHNRIRADRGPGLLFREGSFDHTIAGNVFCLRAPGGSAVIAATPDCTGLDLVGNQFYGCLDLFDGEGEVQIEADNTLTEGYAEPDHATPEYPSIHNWQCGR